MHPPEWAAAFAPCLLRGTPEQFLRLESGGKQKIIASYNIYRIHIWFTVSCKFLPHTCTVIAAVYGWWQTGPFYSLRLDSQWSWPRHQACTKRQETAVIKSREKTDSYRPGKGLTVKVHMTKAPIILPTDSLHQSSEHTLHPTLWNAFQQLPANPLPHHVWACADRQPGSHDRQHQICG